MGAVVFGNVILALLHVPLPLLHATRTVIVNVNAQSTYQGDISALALVHETGMVCF